MTVTTTLSEHMRRAARAAADRTRSLLSMAHLMPLGEPAPHVEPGAWHGRGSRVVSFDQTPPTLAQPQAAPQAPPASPVLAARVALPPLRPAGLQPPRARPRPPAARPGPVDPDAELVGGPPAVLAARGHERARRAAIVLPHLNGPHRALALRLALATRTPTAEALEVLAAAHALPAPAMPPESTRLAFDGAGSIGQGVCRYRSGFFKAPPRRGGRGACTWGASTFGGYGVRQTAVTAATRSRTASALRP
jgi:hypothetical protein